MTPYIEAFAICAAILATSVLAMRQAYRQGRIDGERSAIDRAERAARKESQL